MADPIDTDTILYTFSASAPIQPGVVTVLPYAAPPAPGVDHHAKLTITRRFYDDSTNKAHHDADSFTPTTGFPPRSVLRNTAPPASSVRGASPMPQSGGPSARAMSTSRESTPAPSDQPSSRATSRQPSIGPQSQYSRTYTPPLSSSTLPSSSPPTPSSRATSRQSSVAPDALPSHISSKEPLPHLDDFVPRRRPVTRSVSRGSLRMEPLPGGEDPAGQSFDLDDDNDCSRYRRETWRIPQSDEEKAKGKRYVTTWFHSSASYSLAAPPPCMTQHPLLQLGDIFFHCTPKASEPQIWWWIEGSDGHRFWKRVFKGQLRPDDKRRLSISTNREGVMRPSWVSNTWFQKQEREMKVHKKAKETAS